MTAPQVDVVPGLAPHPSLQRLRARSLVALCVARQRALTGMRVARVFGVVIALAGLVTLLVVSASRGRDVLDVVAARGIAWLSWIVGSIAALSAARDLASLDERDGVVALALERGHSRRALRRARMAASVSVITRLLALPSLILAGAALGLSSSLSLLVPRALFVIGTLAYVVALGIVLGVLARWSAAVSPTRGRALLALIVFAPELAREVWPEVPSVPAAFAWLLDRLLWIGSAAP